MAMNKTEKAEMQAALTRAALGWPPFEEPAPLTLSNEESEGWAMNSYSQEVERRWSTLHSNGRYYEGRRMTPSRGQARLYGSEQDAYKAMRWDMCRHMANRLYGIDQLIRGTN